MTSSTFSYYLHLIIDNLQLNFIQGLERGGYLDSMINSSSTVYLVSVGVSLVLVLWTMMLRRDKDETEPEISSASDESEEVLVEESDENQFEISATDECEFIPLVSEEEDRRVGEEIAPKTRYMQLDQQNPGAHLNMYLDVLHHDDNDEDDIDDDSLTRTDIGQYVTEKDLHILDDPRESPSRRGSVMSRVKKARQRALRNAVEKNMTADDRMKEQMAANQMLSKVYSLMRENKEMFGETSFEQVKSQMDLYKA